MASSLRPIVLFGPSGVGKSTLLKRLFADHPGVFGFSVSHTTRAPRPGETPGSSYHYVSDSEFVSLISSGAFLEHAQFSGNRYGTSAQAVADVAATGKRAVLDIDAQGVQLIKSNHPHLNPIFIFVAPPSFSELKNRLQGRGTETPESITKRIAMAASELAYARKGAADWIIVNDDLDRAYNLLKKAIQEQLKTGEDDKLPEAEKDELEWAQKANAASA